MSNQVYGNDTPPTPNVYVSQLVRAGPAGSTVVKSLRITDTPGLDLTPDYALVRNNAGDVQLGGALIMKSLMIEDLPPDNVGEARPLVREPLVGSVETGTALLVDSLKINVPPAINNTNATVLVRNTTTGVIEQRFATTLPSSGQTERYVTAPQTTTSGNHVVVLFPTVQSTDSGLSYSAGVFQVVTAGIFTIAWTIIWEAAVGTGDRSTWLTKSDSGGTRYANVITTQGGSLSSGKLSGSTTVFMAAASTFEIYAFQSSVGDLDIISAGVDTTRINVSRLSIA